jgi:hypothetical protein
MRAASRAAGRRHGEAPVKRPAIVLLCARFGLSPPCVVGDVPLPTGGGPTGSASSASVWLYGRRPSSAARPRSRDPRAASGSAWPRRDRRAPLVPLATRVLALRRSPCVSERASSEVPGCGHPRAVPLAARSQAQHAPRPWPRILRQPWDSLAMPRSEDRWRPACRPLATARSRRVTFHPYKGSKWRRNRAGSEEGETGESQVGRRSATAFRRLW